MSFYKAIAGFILCVALVVGGGAVGFGFATDWTYKKAPVTEEREEQKTPEPQDEQQPEAEASFALMSVTDNEQVDPITSILDGLKEKSEALGNEAAELSEKLAETAAKNN